MNRKYLRLFLLIVGALLGWLSIGLQYFLLLQRLNGFVVTATIQFFSYFTILSNCLVALAYTCLLFPATKCGRFFARQTVLTAILVYITIVAIVYNLVLRVLWDPQGMQLLVDEFLHVLNPFLFVCYWLFFVRKDALEWKNTFYWLLFPFLYLIWVLGRGYFNGLYPYPFLDVDIYGYAHVFLNSLVLFVLFQLVGLFFILISRWLPDFVGRSSG